MLPALIGITAGSMNTVSLIFYSNYSMVILFLTLFTPFTSLANLAARSFFKNWLAPRTARLEESCLYPCAGPSADQRENADGDQIDANEITQYRDLVPGARLRRVQFHGVSLRLFHDQIIFDGRDAFDGPCDLNCFVDGLLSINKAAQLNSALVGFNTNLK